MVKLSSKPKLTHTQTKHPRTQGNSQIAVAPREDKVGYSCYSKGNEVDGCTANVEGIGQKARQNTPNSVGDAANRDDARALITWYTVSDGHVWKVCQGYGLSCVEEKRKGNAIEQWKKKTK